MSFATANPILLPRASSNLDRVESAFLTSEGLPQFHAAVALGSTSRVSGPCIDRHFNTGVCWGTFNGENTRFVANKDFDTACALEENQLFVSATGSLSGLAGTNRLNTYSSAPQARGPGCTARSYGSYSNCPNCSLSGATVYDCQCNLSNPETIWSTNPSR